MATGACCALALALGGCAGLVDRIVDAQIGAYFHEAGSPPASPVQYDLAKLPFSEYWTGIVFNGEKIGFTRFSIRPAGGDHPRYYEIHSEAAFLLRFLGFQKRINLRSRDLVNPDLTLVEFTYDYTIDGSALRISGRREGEDLSTEIVAGGRPSRQRLPAPPRIYPSSAIMLYPVLHGIALGRDYAFHVYNGQLQTIAEVTQRVLAYERSDFMSRPGFRIETSLHGQRVVTWVDQQGRPAFEIGGRGVMISALEDEDRARRYLVLASLNKNEGLIEYSLIRPDTPLERARAVSALRIALSGTQRVPPSDAAQRCARAGDEIVCEMRVPATGVLEETPFAREKYLQPSITVQSNDPSVRRLAAEIVAGAEEPLERIARIIRWLDANVEKAPIDVFSALDVLEKRRAECQGHAYLYAALARAAGIPTRIVNGLAYSEQLDGFLYHSWAESLIEGRWLAVDPTFGQLRADATHIKLVEGELLGDLVALLDWVGRARIRVLGIEHQDKPAP
ncbi:MAG TPA: transglutaminase-like domain-containing protein [Burkholderiales bacterium]|nr:transglutaminase-like domain-containing protein [Burkholderiales bacterium]